MMIKKTITTFAALLLVLASQAQETAPVEMADGLRSSGKIYIVVGVLCIIFLGIVGYLVAIDRKIKKLEERTNQS